MVSLSLCTLTRRRSQTEGVKGMMGFEDIFPHHEPLVGIFKACFEMPFPVQ